LTKRLIFFSAAALAASALPAQEDAAVPPPAPPPVFIAELPNPNDFTLFGNGGWDGNWYVGHNTLWVSRLPPVPAGDYSRAFIGARLGRMKSEAIPGRPPWEKRPIPGEVDIAVAQEPLWPQSRQFLLTRTENIPLEGDAESAVEGVGESRWFWAEVPLKFLSRQKDNYVALFSPSEALSNAARAPILAAGNGDTRQNSWLNSSVKGRPPVSAAEVLKTTVTYFEPALAIKLVPPNENRVEVVLTAGPAAHPVMKERLVLSATVHGRDVQSAWVEFSTDTRSWRQAAGALHSAPYVFTVRTDRLLPGENWLRAAAVDSWENRGTSEAVSVFVSTATKK
jgi:hypothetical protein